jgi:hypothetical protein
MLLVRFPLLLKLSYHLPWIVSFQTLRPLVNQCRIETGPCNCYSDPDSKGDYKHYSFTILLGIGSTKGHLGCDKEKTRLLWMEAWGKLLHGRGVWAKRYHRSKLVVHERSKGFILQLLINIMLLH